MGVEETMRRIDEYWAPMEVDIDPEDGCVIPRSDADMVETHYVRIRPEDCAVEWNEDNGAIYARIVGDYQDGDIEMRIPLLMLVDMIEAAQRIEASALGGQSGGDKG